MSRNNFDNLLINSQPETLTVKAVRALGAHQGCQSYSRTGTYHIEEFLDAGNSVIVIGRYTGRNRISGKPMSAAAHVYDLRDGKVCRFRMFADTKTIWDSMS